MNYQYVLYTKYLLSGDRPLLIESDAEKNQHKINIPNHLRRCDVNPDDLVVGDGDGITLIPREKINEVFVAAEKRLSTRKSAEKL